MELKKLFLGASIIAALATGSAFAVSGEMQGQLNIDAINQYIAESLQPVTPQEGAKVTNLSIRLNEEGTVLSKNKYSADVSGVINELSWGAEAMPFHLRLNFKAPKDQQKPLKLKAHLTLKGDSVSAWKHMTKSMMPCPAPPSVTGVMRLLAQDDCKTMDDIQQVSGIHGLYHVFEDSISRQKRMVLSHIHSLVFDYSKAKSSITKQWIQQELIKSQRVYRALLGSKLSRIPGGFSFEMGELKLDESMWFQKFKTNVTRNETQFIFVVKSKVGRDLFEASEPEIENFLYDLADGRIYAKKLVKMDGQVLLNYLTRWSERDL